jgi:hypothetical protein
MKTGSCLCGGVQYEISGNMRPVVNCHCGQCRKTSGHYWAATAVSRDDLTIKAESTLSWYQSSDAARRGFCTRCGASLFWDHSGEDEISIGAGTLDLPTGLTTGENIYIEDKADYYDLSGPVRSGGGQTGNDSE